MFDIDRYRMLNLIFACEFLYKNYIYNMIPKLEFLFFSVNRLYNNFCVNITYFHQYQSHLCVFMPMSYNCVNVKVICVYPCQCHIIVSMSRSSVCIHVNVIYLCQCQGHLCVSMSMSNKCVNVKVIP